MAKELRKGSMAAADAKSNKTFMIVAGIIYLAIVLLLVGVGDTFLGRYASRAPLLANAAGIVFIILSYLYLYTSVNSEKWVLKTIVIAGLLIFGICLACGFNFDQFGIE